MSERSSTEFLCFVPAAGKGSRLGALTTRHAKPSLPLSFDTDGRIERMIDVPLRAVRALGGLAFVTTHYAAESMDFVRGRRAVEVFDDGGFKTSAEALFDLKEVIRSVNPETIGIVPGDAHITTAQLEDLLHTHLARNAIGTILASRHLDGHNTRPRSRHGYLTSAEQPHTIAADLGIHLLNGNWLLEQLDGLGDQRDRGIDIWQDIYTTQTPVEGVQLHIPHEDTGWVDMGTPGDYYRTVMHANTQRITTAGNVIFPGARLAHYHTTDTIALPDSYSELPHRHAILPEQAIITSQTHVVNI